MPFMRTVLILLILPFIQVSGMAQIDSQEYKTAKQVFNSEIYEPTDYPRFAKKIESTNDGRYKFGDKYLEVNLKQKDLEGLFLLGVFNPDVILGETRPVKTKEEIESLTTSQRLFYNIGRNDSVSICCFESLERLNPNFKTKRFVFWLYRKGSANPIQYYIEFKNTNATKRTSLEGFIKEAKMTFFYKGSVII